ncbi:TRAP transporter large permease subunit [Halobellus ordinarius]|uniref:TRAP transporter large permease subunit n=1 Tax=Halobellus ordinarius TaxID=3075120 RepID=UPI002880BC66|nr:TRAP transporter large permease subunit [Halobellus sp. ZY16]
MYDFLGVGAFLMRLPTLRSLNIGLVRSINISPVRSENKDFDHRLPEHIEGCRGPVIWGMIFIMGDTVGFITPPYGLNLYIISGIAELDYIRVARAIVPYLLGLVAVWVGYAVIHLYI